MNNCKYKQVKNIACFMLSVLYVTPLLTRGLLQQSLLVNKFYGQATKGMR